MKITYIKKNKKEKVHKKTFSRNLFHTVKNMVSYFLQVKFTMDWEPYMTTDKWVWN